MKIWNKLKLKTLFIFMSFLYISNTKSLIKEDVKIIPKLEKKEQIIPVIEWAKKNEDAIYKEYYIEASDLEDLDCYLVDVNNDGKDEFVFLKHVGSFGYFTLFIFQKTPEGIKIIECPFDVEGSCPEKFVNPFTNEVELFVKAQNKIYIYLSSDDQLRSIYLWQDNKFSLVCDKFWIKQQRDLFNKLYQKKRYNDAYLFLSDFEEKHRGYLEPELDLWIKNDIVLAVFHDGYPQVGLKIINSIKKDTAFSKVSSNLKKSVSTNEELCLKAIEEDRLQGSKGKFDYTWLLLYKEKSLEDDRLEQLYSALIPDIRDPNQQFWGQFSNSPHRWKDEIKRHLGQYYHNINVLKDRFITFDGCIAHCTSQRGFAWCDIKNQVSVAAIGGTMDEDDMLYITSRSLKAKELPPEFFEALNIWLKENKIIFSGILFYDYTGKPSAINFTVKDTDLT